MHPKRETQRIYFIQETLDFYPVDLFNSDFLDTHFTFRHTFLGNLDSAKLRKGFPNNHNEQKKNRNHPVQISKFQLVSNIMHQHFNSKTSESVCFVKKNSSVYQSTSSVSFINVCYITIYYQAIFAVSQI